MKRLLIDVVRTGQPLHQQRDVFGFQSRNNLHATALCISTRDVERERFARRADHDVPTVADLTREHPALPVGQADLWPLPAAAGARMTDAGVEDVVVKGDRWKRCVLPRSRSRFRAWFKPACRQAGQGNSLPESALSSRNNDDCKLHPGAPGEKGVETRILGCARYPFGYNHCKCPAIPARPPTCR